MLKTCKGGGTVHFWSSGVQDQHPVLVVAMTILRGANALIALVPTHPEPSSSDL